MNLQRYSKLIAAIAGNIVAILIAWLAVQFPGVADCTAVPADALQAADFDQVCTVLGFSQAQITGGLMFAINSLFVYAFPPNRPAAA